MQEADEQDTCRICSAPAEPDQPLFHPCKCSGTIRYIHQDCLTTWLAHSKKKTCDVCKHPYSFTKVYALDMPSHLPPLLLIRRLVQHFLLAILFVIRAIAVAIIWLAVLPWVTIWTWRMYFSMGESTAWWISDRPKPFDNDSSTSLYQRLKHESPVSASKSVLSRIAGHPVWISLSADIFTGQIVAALIVLTFVAVFLLREWISQNARPGVFEDEEALPDDQVNPEVLPVVQQPQPLQPPLHDILPEPNGLAERQQDAVRALDALRAREHAYVNDRARYLHVNKESGKRRAPADEQPSQNGRSEQDDIDRKKSRAYKQRVKMVRALAARRRVFANQQDRSNSSTPPLLPHDSPHQNFDFTFKAAPLTISKEENEEEETPRWLLASSAAQQSSSSPYSSIFPPVVLQPPNEAIPFSLSSFTPMSSTSSPNPLDERATSEFTSRRPPLPASSFASPTSDSPFLVSPRRTSTESPSLATYRAPEELEPDAGPSSLRSYFDRIDSDVEMADLEDDTDNDSKSDDEIQRAQTFDIPDYSSAVAEERRSEGSTHGLVLLSNSDESHEDSDDDAAEDEGGDDSLDDSGESGEEDGQLHELFDDDDEDEEVEEDEDDLFFAEEDDDDDNEGERAGREQEGVPNQAGNAPANENEGNGGQEDANARRANDVNEEADGNVEDDMEGAMEAIGMRGPLYGVFQNAALMVFVLDTAIGLCIWIPFTIGKSTALLSLDPPRLLQILHLPIRAMRLITDPIVDSAAFLLTRFLLPPYLRLIRNTVDLLSSLSSNLVSKLFNDKVINELSRLSSKIYDQSAEMLSQPFSRMSSWSQSTIAAESVISSNAAPPLFPEFARPIEPYFVLLGRHVRLTFTKLQETWIRLALGNGSSERIFAVVLGYFVIGLVLALYLNLLTVGNAKTAGRAIRSAVRQQLLVVKVASFIFIELVTFPLGCGIVLDICTVWLFPEANIQSRMAFFAQAPLTAMFYHWVAGTMFMYSFAVLLSGCRSVIRPGAMWFIKDPQDQNSHPIRDILERPTLTQLRKICISGVMYSIVVACVVGSVAGLLLLGSKSIMPFRWKNREPLSNVPVDLLFLHLVLPQTMQYFRPKRAMKQLATLVWRALALRLRLTSYFFGGRYPQEERSPLQWGGPFPWLQPYDVEPESTPDGTFRRVPATDNLALPREMRATASVTEDGVPTDEESKELIEQQNAEAEKAKRDVKTDFMIVYIPPHFRYRIFVFICFLWIIGAVLLGVGVALPIQLGRSIFKLFTAREVHDGYSLIVGFYLLWGCYLVGKAVDRLDKRRQRSKQGDSPRADLGVLILKRGFIWVAKMAYMIIFLGILIPILVALVVDLYIVLPIRFSLNPEMTPKIRVVDAWALGLLYVKIALHATQIHPPNQVSRGLQQIVANGLARPDPANATKDVIAPLVGGLIGMIMFPGCVFQLVRYLSPGMTFDNKFIFMNVYPGIFMFAGLLRSSVVLYDTLSSWSQAIRDKEFLVELRLKNHEPEKGDLTGKDTSTAKAAITEDQPNRHDVNHPQ